MNKGSWACRFKNKVVGQPAYGALKYSCYSNNICGVLPRPDPEQVAPSVEPLPIHRFTGACPHGRDDTPGMDTRRP